MAKGAGGGINSNQVRKVGQRLGGPAMVKNPGHVAQFGLAQGSHSERGDTNYRGEPKGMRPASPNVRLGKELTGGTDGPGKGRTVMRGGSQGQHGPVAGSRIPPAGELFPGWPAKERA
jgi:hypothetical protein